MKRLTKRTITGTAILNEIRVPDICMHVDWCDKYDFCDGCSLKKIIDRLCEYEDTGLSPEEIKKRRIKFKCRNHR